MSLVIYWEICPFIFFFILIVLLTPFINKPDSSNASVADTTAVNPNSFNTFSANGLSTFFSKNNPFFSNAPKSLSKNVFFYAIEFLIVLY